MKSTLPFAFLFLGLVFFISPASAEEYTVVDLSNNAWITRRGLTNLSSVTLGDSLQNGDRLETLRGNTARLSLDDSGQNIVRLDENSSIVADDSELGAGFVVTKGRLFASVKNLSSRSRFKISTPTAIATVRGTQFEVAVSGNASQVLNFSGSVEVAKRLPDGSETKENIVLSAGEKVVIEGFESPLTKKEITTEEMARLQIIAQELEPGKVVYTNTPETPKKEKNKIIVDSYIAPPGN